MLESVADPAVEVITFGFGGEQVVMDVRRAIEILIEGTVSEFQQQGRFPRIVTDTGQQRGLDGNGGNPCQGHLTVSPLSTFRFRSGK